MSINTFAWLTQHCSIEPLAIKPGFTLDEKEGVETPRQDPQIVNLFARNLGRPADRPLCSLSTEFDEPLALAANGYLFSGAMISHHSYGWRDEPTLEELVERRSDCKEAILRLVEKRNTFIANKVQEQKISSICKSCFITKEEINRFF